MQDPPSGAPPSTFDRAEEPAKVEDSKPEDSREEVAVPEDSKPVGVVVAPGLLKRGIDHVRPVSENRQDCMHIAHHNARDGIPSGSASIRGVDV